MQDARNSGNKDSLAARVNEYDAVLDRYVSAVMAQASVYWRLGQYSTVLHILGQAQEFASEHKTWRLNMAHTHFVMVCINSFFLQLQ